MPAVSVLLPCFQAEDTLTEALDSLFVQTFRNFEVVAVDDGSTDRTLEVLHSRAQNDPRLRVISIPHAGIITALNAGLANCLAELVARMDTDDRCHPHRLETQFTYMQLNPDVSVLGSQVNAFPEDDVQEGLRRYLAWQNSLLSDSDIRREMFVESPLTHPSVMFRKQAVLAINGYEEHGWAEDYDLWLRLYVNGAGFAKIPEVLVDWREHLNRLTRQDGRYSSSNFLNAKIHYLVQGPLRDCDAVIIWGAGSIGKYIGRGLQKNQIPLRAYVDVDRRKIGRTRRGLPVLAPMDLRMFCKSWRRPVILAAVGVRGARDLIRKQLDRMEFVEGKDWLAVA